MERKARVPQSVSRWQEACATRMFRKENSYIPMTRENVLLKMLKAALWSRRLNLSGRQWPIEQYQSLMRLAEQQAVSGMVAQMLMDSGVQLTRPAAAEVYALAGSTRQRNEEMDAAVVALCQKMEELGIRIIVFKGQTLARLYPDPGVRQSGDIDFACHPDDWERAEAYFRSTVVGDIEDNTTEKHISFNINGIEYELHRSLTAFAYPAHQRYWEKRIMPEVWEKPHFIEINSFLVPTLPPATNAIFVSVHIFYHLISEGIGLRQFCDWAMVLNQSTIDKPQLTTLLEGIGLRKAYAGMGAILTDYLGLPTASFPLEISKDDHKRAPKLLENIWEMGNFGKNKQYSAPRGVVHGLQHLWRIAGQARRFYHYAPAETLWTIPYMFRWWGIKIKNIVAHALPAKK